SFCTSMAVAKTMSAHSMSELESLRTFKSIRRRSHDSGSNAETVSRPSGGKAQRFPSNGNACRKLQYVSGNSGLIIKTFINSPLDNPDADQTYTGFLGHPMEGSLPLIQYLVDLNSDHCTSV